MVLVGGRNVIVAASLLKLGDASGELGPRTGLREFVIQNGSTEEFGKKLQFVTRKARQETAGFGLHGSIGA
jgi:hypothetical protein